jgi:hypothetical protein
MNILDQMPRKLRDQLERDVHARIPEEWVRRGYHWCDGSDGILVGPGDSEMQACCCDFQWLKQWK